MNEYTEDSTRFIDEMDIRKVTALFEYYGVAPAFYSILDLFALNGEEELLSAGLKAKYYHDQFLEDFNHISDFFEKNNVWYVPLKNAVLLDCWSYKQYYINDNAFLIATEGMAVLDRLFRIPDDEYPLSEYKTLSEENTERCVTCYTNLNMKCRFYAALFEDEPEFITYFETMLSRLKTDNKFEDYLKTRDYKYLRSLDYEDVYIYLTMCAYIRYRDSKAKLRSLVEIYSMCEPKMNDKRKKIDIDFVRKELQKLNLAEFEQTHRSLAIKLLSVKNQEPLTEQETEMLERYFYPKDFNADKLTSLEHRSDPQTVYGSIYSVDESDHTGSA